MSSSRVVASEGSLRGPDYRPLPGDAARGESCVRCRGQRKTVARTTHQSDDEPWSLERPSAFAEWVGPDDRPLLNLDTSDGDDK